MSYRKVLAAIKAADLSAPTYRTARELLDLAAQQKGGTWLSMTLLCEIAGTKSEGTARRHLIDLRASGILKYALDGDEVSVRFPAWPVITQRAYTRVQRAATPPDPTPAPVEDDDSEDHPARVEDHPARGTARFSENGHREEAPQLVGCLVVNRPIPTNGNGYHQPNNQNGAAAAAIAADGGIVATAEVVEAPAAEAPPNLDEKLTDAPTPYTPHPTPHVQDPADHARAFALLTDPEIAVAPAKAKVLAAQGFAEIRRQVAAAWNERHTKNNWAGFLITRIEKRWGAPEVSSDFKATELYVRHMTPEERAEAEREREEYAQELARRKALREESEKTKPQPVERDPGDPWTIVLIDIKAGSYAHEIRECLEAATLRDAGMIEGDGGPVQHYEIVIPSMHARWRSWLESRLLQNLRRTLSSIVKRPVLATFVIAEAPA